MNESKLVVWFSYLDKDGNKETYTFRMADNEKVKKYLEYIESVKVGLKEKGYTPLSSPKTEKANGAFEPVRTALQAIDVESIELASGGEHPRWVVKGGWAKKFGITCWPEVLEDAGILDMLDPLTSNQVVGYTAYYSEKVHEGETKADKVVRIVKV